MCWSAFIYLFRDCSSSKTPKFRTNTLNIPTGLWVHFFFKTILPRRIKGGSKRKKHSHSKSLSFPYNITLSNLGQLPKVKCWSLLFQTSTRFSFVPQNQSSSQANVLFLCIFLVWDANIFSPFPSREMCVVPFLCVFATPSINTQPRHYVMADMPQRRYRRATFCILCSLNHGSEVCDQLARQFSWS